MTLEEFQEKVKAGVAKAPPVDLDPKVIEALSDCALLITDTPWGPGYRLEYEGVFFNKVPQEGIKSVPREEPLESLGIIDWPVEEETV